MEERFGGRGEAEENEDEEEERETEADGEEIGENEITKGGGALPRLARLLAGGFGGWEIGTAGPAAGGKWHSGGARGGLQKNLVSSQVFE